MEALVGYHKGALCTTPGSEDSIELFSLWDDNKLIGTQHCIYMQVKSHQCLQEIFLIKNKNSAWGNQDGDTIWAKTKSDR